MGIRNFIIQPFPFFGTRGFYVKKLLSISVLDNLVVAAFASVLLVPQARRYCTATA
jgi:hypothetical protein